jgi:hypothetical protein
VIDKYQRFRGTSEWSSEGECSTLVPIYQTTRSYIPEDHNLKNYLNFYCSLCFLLFLSISISTHIYLKREGKRYWKEGKERKESQLEVARFISIATVEHVA